jgi:hypothetical protein
MPTYARLICRVYRRRATAVFDGPVFRCGTLIDAAALWPDESYPGFAEGFALVLEFAGSDATGRGHRRSNDIYILWRYERKRNAFVEVVRCVSQGLEWIDYIRPVAITEMGLIEVRDAFIAQKVVGRVLAMLDAELETLGSDDCALVMGFVYEQFIARATTHTYNPTPVS